RRLPLREKPPTEAEPERSDDARPRKPAAERPLPADKCQGQPEGGWRPDAAERILRERRHAERREARGDTPAPFLGETGEDEREAPRERRDEECFGTDVAREREEPRARQERRPRDEAAARAEELGAQPGRRRYSGEGAERGNRARRRLARAGEGEGSTQEHVEERRLGHVADAVEGQHQSDFPIAASTPRSTVWSWVASGSSVSIQRMRSRLKTLRSTMIVVRFPPSALRWIRNRCRVPLA